MLPLHYQQQNLHCIPPPCSSQTPSMYEYAHHHASPHHHNHHNHHNHLRPPPPPPPPAFPQFRRLPAEIRTLIWAHALPDPRVYEIMDVPHARQSMAAVDGLMFANVHDEPPPALAAVCHESRQLVLARYRPLTLGRTTKHVDLARDLLLLEPYLLLKRLHRTLHFMSRLPLLRTHMAALALGTSYGTYTGISHPVLGSSGSGGGGRHHKAGNGSASASVKNNTNLARLLAALAAFRSLRTLLFVVHQEFQFEFDPRYPTPAGLLPASSRPPPRSVPSLADTSQYNNNNNDNNPPPQVVHQAYRFKFDVESNINGHPRRPHLNDLQFYPLDTTLQNDNDDTDDWDELINNSINNNNNNINGRIGGLDVDDPDGGEWCDPWPTNDDWRRFRRRFQRAVVATLQAGLVDGSGSGSGSDGQHARQPRCDTQYGGGSSSSSSSSSSKLAISHSSSRSSRTSHHHHHHHQLKHNLPAIKGASLLWRYSRGV